MNDSPRKVSPLRQRMIEEMRMRQLAPKTRDAVHSRSPSLHPISGPLTRYGHGRGSAPLPTALRRSGRSLPITLNATITGLKFLFEVTLGQPELMAKMQPRAHVAHLADHFESRGSEPPARRGEEPQASAPRCRSRMARDCASAK